jgi:hypothetical protein
MSSTKIFRNQHLSVTNKFYFEFGFNSATFEGGSGANTYALWKHGRMGWKGLLLDGDNDNPAINLHKEYITPRQHRVAFRQVWCPKRAGLRVHRCRLDRPVDLRKPDQGRLPPPVGDG